MLHILIVGGGWLGEPLAQHFMQLGHQVTITKTTEAGVNELSQKGLNAALLKLSAQKDEAITPEIDFSIFNWVIGAFPPGLRKQKELSQSTDYATRWFNLTQMIKKSSNAHCLMVSTTGVYPNQATPMIEADASWLIAQESDQFSDKSRAILNAEQQLIDSALPYVILRCSGLVGPNRHPARFIQYLKTVSTKAKANMVHLDDVIGACHFLIHQSLNNEIFNLTVPESLTKWDFYQTAIGQDDLSQYVSPNDQTDKEILSHKIQQAGYQFRYPKMTQVLDELNKTSPAEPHSLKIG